MRPNGDWANGLSTIAGAGLCLCLWPLPARQAAAQQVPTITLAPPTASYQADLSLVTSVRELADGTLLVVDLLDHAALLLGGSGNGLLSQIGRVGDGPGEYRAPRWLFALSGDSTLLTDAQSRRWLLLSGRRIVGTLAAHEPPPRLFGPSLGGADERGRVLESLYDRTRFRRGEPDSGFVVLAERGSARMDTIARLFRPARPTLRVSRPELPVTYWMVNPFIVPEQALLFRDGWIALALMNPYRVDWITPDGDRLRGAPLPFEHVRVDDAEKRFAAEQEGAFSREITFRPENFPDWPATLPPFREEALLAAPEGRLLIRRTASARDPSTKYDLIDRAGRLVGRLRLASNQHIIGFGVRSVYVISRDEYDVQSLSRHPWP